MATVQKIETLSKLTILVIDLAKLAGIIIAGILVLAVFVYPKPVKEKLKEFGFEIKEVDAGLFKLVAAETAKAGVSTLQIAQSLTNAEVKLTAANGDVINTAVVKNLVADALSTIQSARAALDEQSVALKSTGKSVGVTPDIPAKGWLFVGYFDESEKMGLSSDRVASANGVRPSGGRSGQIVLKFDAAVISDGDDCTKTNVADFQLPDPNAPERRYVIIRASPAPLEVLATSWCPAPGKGKTVYAQIAVPKDRVRFAKLSTLAR